MNDASSNDLNFLISNYHLGVKECSRVLGVSQRTIRSWYRKYDIYHSFLDRRIDISRFENIAEPEIAYFLGLIWADGNVSKGKYTELQIGLKMEDFLSLQGLFEKIGDFKYYTVKPHTNSPNTSKCLKTSHRKLNFFLRDHNFCEKSYTSACKILNKIPEHLKKYWWRGYFDGDGHVKVDKAGRWGFIIASTFDQDWSFATSLLKHLKIDFRIRKIVTKNGKNSIIGCQNRDGFLKFFSYLYSNYDNIGLKRKYSSYQEGLKLIEKCKESLRLRSKPILYYTEDWQFLGRCESIRDLSRTLKISENHIRVYFRESKKHCCHYQFKKE